MVALSVLVAEYTPERSSPDVILFIFAAQTLAAFIVEKARNVDGEEIEPAEEFRNGIISRPKDFMCSIKPRSNKKKVDSNEAVKDEHPFEPSHSSELLDLVWKRTCIFRLAHVRLRHFFSTAFAR
ncbi:hypothetical protein SCHPADRAFT_549850 [Schizopora paradoxa]|uniref:Uncharacterized protein n=1 Tax=Schizopora paradoxa TaxID=27342 RepID=A0A0H2RDA3_9AGAM|nr:hypothetical protein SCHPADRAFT_549850 [Schizopora paradoxa]